MGNGSSSSASSETLVSRRNWLIYEKIATVAVGSRPLAMPDSRRTLPATEDDFIVGGAGNGAQGLGDVVVLFDQGGSQSLAAEMFRCPEDRLLEVGMFRQFHVATSSASAMSWQSADR